MILFSKQSQRKEPMETFAKLFGSLRETRVYKWIKRHLRIKAFYGTSGTAVKTQIWIAVSIYVLVPIVRKQLGLAASLYQTLQILSVTLFEKTSILCALQAPDADAEFTENVNRLILFDISPDSSVLSSFAASSLFGELLLLKPGKAQRRLCYWGSTRRGDMNP
jgi:hypothetical protein